MYMCTQKFQWQKLLIVFKISVVFYVLISVCYLVLASASNISQAILCPGNVLTTECTNTGDGTTVWQGTAIQCDYGEISLVHSRFSGPRYPIATCNNGAIAAQGLRVINDSYISQLNFTVSPELNNTTMECWYDNGTTVMFIRSIQITVSATG